MGRGSTGWVWRGTGVGRVPTRHPFFNSSPARVAVGFTHPVLAMLSYWGTDAYTRDTPLKHRNADHNGATLCPPSPRPFPRQAKIKIAILPETPFSWPKFLRFALLVEIQSPSGSRKP